MVYFGFWTQRREGGCVLRVADVMTRNVYTAQRETPLEEIAQTLTSRRVGGVPVLDERRCPVGVITKADILFARPVSVSSGTGGGSSITARNN